MVAAYRCAFPCIIPRVPSSNPKLCNRSGNCAGVGTCARTRRWQLTGVSIEFDLSTNPLGVAVVRLLGPVHVIRSPVVATPSASTLHPASSCWSNLSQYLCFWGLAEINVRNLCASGCPLQVHFVAIMSKSLHFEEEVSRRQTPRLTLAVPNKIWLEQTSPEVPEFLRRGPRKWGSPARMPWAFHTGHPQEYALKYRKKAYNGIVCFL